MTTKLFEAHITIEPVFDDRLDIVKMVAGKWNFKVAELLMVKNRQDTPQRSNKDSFMTGHSNSYKILEAAIKAICNELHQAEVKVWRYKIEEIVLDSRNSDSLNLLNK